MPNVKRQPFARQCPQFRLAGMATDDLASLIRQMRILSAEIERQRATLARAIAAAEELERQARADKVSSESPKAKTAGRN